MTNLFIGNFRAAFHGRGIEFEDFREYGPNDDSKYIDWAVSSREGRMIMRQYREEKQGNVFCIFHVSESLWQRNAEKYHMAQEIIELLWLASKSCGEAFWGMLFSRNSQYIPAKKSLVSKEQFFSQGFPEALSPEKKLDISLWNRLPEKRSIVFILSDSMLVDEKSIHLASIKHDVIFLHIADSFEDLLIGQGMNYMHNTRESVTINLDDQRKKQEYIQKRSAQKQAFAQKLRSLWTDIAFFRSSESIFPPFLELMRARI